MPQPESWSDEERELLRSAEDDAPTPGAQSRTLAALGVGGAAIGGGVAVAGTAKAASLASATPGAALSTAAASAGKALLVAKLLAVVVAGGLAGGAVLHYRNQATAPAAVAARTTEAAPAGPVAIETTAATPDVAAPPEVAPSVAKATVAPARGEPDIALEIESLDRARRDQGRGDFAAALSELDQYDRAFRQGRLRPEALVLRVQTLIGKGDAAGAKALGSRFLARYPNSPIAPRIQKLIGAGKE